MTTKSVFFTYTIPTSISYQTFRVFLWHYTVSGKRPTKFFVNNFNNKFLLIRIANKILPPLTFPENFG